MVQTVLIIESQKIQQYALITLLSTTYEVIVGDNKTSVIEQILKHLPDLVILDQVDLCLTIRQHCPSIIIVVLSTHAQEKQSVQAFELGADDYIRKPFSDQELKARIRAHLRRAIQPRDWQKEPEQLSSADQHISLHIKQRQTSVGGHLVHLTPTEFALLWQLLLHAGEVLTHRTLLQTVWGPEYGQEEDYLRVYVHQIRRKIEENPSHPCYLLTEAGIGYVFRCSSSSSSSLYHER